MFDEKKRKKNKERRKKQNKKKKQTKKTCSRADERNSNFARLIERLQFAADGRKSFTLLVFRLCSSGNRHRRSRFRQPTVRLSGSRFRQPLPVGCTFKCTAGCTAGCKSGSPSRLGKRHIQPKRGRETVGWASWELVGVGKRDGGVGDTGAGIYCG